MVDIASTLQTDIYTILSGDSNVTAITTEITDGMPTNLVKGGDGPFILVHTPEMTGDRINLSNTKFKTKCTAEIELFSRQESNVRSLVDKISQSLIDNQNTTRAHNIFWCNPRRNTIDMVWLSNESSKPMWHGRLMVEYLVVS